MARDPFAPVPQSSVPKWVWIVVGMVGLVIVGVISTVALVISRRPQAVVAAPTVTPANPETPAGTTTPPTTPAGDKTAAAPSTDSKPDGDDDGDKPEKKKKHGGSKHASKHEPKKPAAPSAPSPPPKPKSNMSQKDIDKLLGI